MSVDSKVVAELRDHVTVNLGLVGSLLAFRGGDELDRLMVRELAQEIVERYAPLIAGGLYAPQTAAVRGALRLAATDLGIGS